MRDRMESGSQALTVTHIQRMCFHDGPGIRTTVFMKGCSIHCPWCSNPENITFAVETYEKDGIKGTYGKEYTPSELVDVITKDQDFWGSDGGVTFSGGEALMQADSLVPVLEQLKEHKIHVAAETALFVPTEKLQKVLPYMDYVIADVKILEEAGCRNVLGGSIALYKKNVDVLYHSGKLKLFRVPCCFEYTFTEENKTLIRTFFNQYRDIPVQVFAIHDLGEKKYESLNRPMWRAKVVEKDSLTEYCRQLESDGIRAEVIQI